MKFCFKFLCLAHKKSLGIILLKNIHISNPWVNFPRACDDIACVRLCRVTEQKLRLHGNHLPQILGTRSERNIRILEYIG